MFLSVQWFSLIETVFAAFLAFSFKACFCSCSLSSSSFCRVSISTFFFKFSKNWLICCLRWSCSSSICLCSLASYTFLTKLCHDLVIKVRVAFSAAIYSSLRSSRCSSSYLCICLCCCSVFATLAHARNVLKSPKKIICFWILSSVVSCHIVYALTLSNPFALSYRVRRWKIPCTMVSILRHLNSLSWRLDSSSYSRALYRSSSICC